MSFIKQNLNDDPRYVKSRAKFDSHCHECEGDIEQGDEYVFDTKYKKAYCMACGEEYL